MAFVVTAIATAVELGTFAAIATAVSEVGIALTVVGAVTGNKELIKIGGVLGLAGGIGGLAASFASGVTGAAVESVAATAAEDAAGGTLANEAATAADYVNGADLASDTATNSSGIVAGASEATTLAPNLATVAPEGSLAPTAATDTALQPQIAPTSAATAPASSGLGAQAPTGPVGAQAPITPADYNVGGRFGPDNIDVGGGASPAGSGSPGVGSLFDQFSGWVRSNPKLAELGMQVVGGAFKGMSDYSLAQQKLAQQQQLINQQSYGNQIGMWSPTKPVGIIGGGRS